MQRMLITNSNIETQNAAENFVPRSGILLRRTRSPIIIALYGELGSGKTTFVQGLAKGLGIKRRIISPTFIIIRSYALINQKSKIKSQNDNSKFKSLKQRTFYHTDLYRIRSEREIEGLGIEEIMNDSQNIVAIEWAEKIAELLPKERIDIYFEYVDENKRKITIKN